MKNRWSDEQNQLAIKRWGSEVSAEVASRIYTARLLGEQSSLVLAGGGNVSLKTTQRDRFGDDMPVLCVKATGYALEQLTPAGLPALNLVYLRRLATLPMLDDADMLGELHRACLDHSAAVPSIEALVHAALPARFVDHTHADSVLSLTNLENGEARIHEALGEDVIVLSYVRPGFELAKALAKAVAGVAENFPDIRGIVLMQHGLITFGDSARQSYDRHIEMVSACESYIQKQTRSCQPTLCHVAGKTPSQLVTEIAPTLRGLAAYRSDDGDEPIRKIMHWNDSDDVLAFVNSDHLSEAGTTGPLTGDHAIHARPWPLVIEKPAWHGRDKLHSQLEKAFDRYRTRYSDYITAHGGSASEMDLNPVVALVAGVGILCFASTKEAALLACSITEHTLAVKSNSNSLGSYKSLSDDQLFDNEFRLYQRRKLQTAESLSLSGQVVAISGGAGAMGVGIAQVCLEAGAHVVLADIDMDRLHQAAESLRSQFASQRVAVVRMDVTDDDSVRDGFDEIIRTFGGVDVVVANAGIAHVASIETLLPVDFDRLMQVNTTGCLRFVQSSTAILKAQGLGGSVIVNASKNVFAPGRDFGAYSASKAAAHQLGKVAAIELAAYGIRVNMINADAVFGDEAHPSGLWAQVGPDRAASRGLKKEDLPEFYRNRNLLKVRVDAKHVGQAVVFLATKATATTGATIPIDGGIAAAFPR